MKLKGKVQTSEATDCQECGHTLLRGTHADNAGGPGDCGWSGTGFHVCQAPGAINGPPLEGDQTP